MNERVTVVQHASGWCVLLHGFPQAAFDDEQRAMAEALILKAQREASGSQAALVVHRRPSARA